MVTPLLGIFGPFSVLTYMIEGSESELPLFTELKKLNPLSRYRASSIAKMAVFHSLAKFLMRFVENHESGNNLASDHPWRVEFGPRLHNFDI